MDSEKLAEMKRNIKKYVDSIDLTQLTEDELLDGINFANRKIAELEKESDK